MYAPRLIWVYTPQKTKGVRVVVVSEIQVYPAAYCSELEEELNRVAESVSTAGVKRNQIKFDSEFDGNRYQVKFWLTDSAAAKLKAHQNDHPEMYYA